ncbi:transmembrane protein 214 isoform X3 [Astyanax mexicanus]|uniref:transmembrane protein 214 isoform X3 n=1 Tax=Astyanax mexicanus TaxID=7994 RepID=UPI000BBD75E2|nr:transmembrane protein 214 isoform X3 [Astyanax mexicanus]
MASPVNNSSVGKWEVVRKGKKRLPDKKYSGVGRKAPSESSSSRVDSYPVSVKMSETIFENFEKFGKKQHKEQVHPPAETQQKKSNAVKQNRKSMNCSPKEIHYKTLEDAVKALDVVELRQQLERSQSLFPENPCVWVKDLAGYLNSKLLAPDTDPTLSSHAHDYPYCLAGKELRSIIKNLFGKSTDTLQDFFDHCIFTMLRELEKQPGEPLHGYRMCIQAVTMNKPRIATLNLADHLELLRSNQNRPSKCLSIMWALGQAGFHDLTQGIKVWLGIMLPVLGIKSLSAYAIAYLERLLTFHANLTKGFGVMGPKEFFPLLDFAYMPKNALSPSLQEQLRKLYPRLKVLAFGAKPESTLHTYFPSFLSRATPSCPDAMKKELLNSLTECLSVDAQSLGVWRQLYTKHLTQSGLLLNHLLNSWTTLSLKSLQMKIHCQGFPWSRLLMAVLVFAAGFIVHDVKLHGTFTESTTALYLERIGVTAVSKQAWRKVSHCSQQCISWLAENMPHYYSVAVESLGPLLEATFEKLKEASVFVAQNSSDLIQWLQENTPLLIEWISDNTPNSVFQFLEFMKNLLLLVHQTYILPAFQYFITSLQHGWQSLKDSCNGEVSLHCMQGHVVALTNSTWIYLQDTTTAIRSWAQELLSIV